MSRISTLAQIDDCESKREHELHSPTHQTVSGGVDILDNFTSEDQQPNILIPQLQMLSENDNGLNSKAQGLNRKAGFQRVGDKMYLDLTFYNKSGTTFSDLAIKFNSNTFNLSPTSIALNIESISPGQSQETRILLNTQNQPADLRDYPFLVQVALRTNIDMFLFEIPCSLSVVMLPGMSVQVQKYKQLLSNPSNSKIQQQLTNKLDLESFVRKLKANNLSLVYRKNDGNREMMSYICCLLNGRYGMVDVIFDRMTSNVMLQISSQQGRVACADKACSGNDSSSILQYLNYIIYLAHQSFSPSLESMKIDITKV